MSGKSSFKSYNSDALCGCSPAPGQLGEKSLVNIHSYFSFVEKARIQMLRMTTEKYLTSVDVPWFGQIQSEEVYTKYVNYLRSLLVMYLSGDC